MFRESPGEAAKGHHASGLQLRNYRRQIRCTGLRASLESLAAGAVVLRRECRSFASVAAELHAAGLRCRKSRLRPSRDHLPLCLGNHGHDMNHQLVRFRHIGGDEAHAGLLEPCQKVDVTGEPIELGDNELRPVEPTGRDCPRELRTIIARAAFDFRELGGDRRCMTLEEIRDCCALRFETQSRRALPLC